MILFLKKMHHNKITNMRYTFLYLFICYLTNIIPSIEYAQIKKNQIISKEFSINACTYLFYYFYLIQILGLYKFYPPNRNLVLEICKIRDIERLVVI
jgi:hypothetical protein